MKRILDLDTIRDFRAIDYTRLTAEFVSGVKCVGVTDLLDILDKRAILLLRQCADPAIADKQAQIHRGQLVEIEKLYKALKSHED